MTQGLTKLYTGKVRDVYQRRSPHGEDDVILKASDRVSAFDRHVGIIPHKGVLVTCLSGFWFERIGSFIPHHMKHYQANVMVCKPVKVFPVEFIIRGYLMGVTTTSLWHRYSQDKERTFAGQRLPEGMQQGDPLPAAIITPTTKDAGGDTSITYEGILRQQLISKGHLDQVYEYTRRLYAWGSTYAQSKGWILVDTKYEFGLDHAGQICLCDEVHTGDSSRYWKVADYEASRQEGTVPTPYDKEFLRTWIKKHVPDPYHAKKIRLSKECIRSFRSRYVDLYEGLTGCRFHPSRSP